MNVHDVMSPEMATVGPSHTLREAARIMANRNVGSALVLDVDGEYPAIITERDILRSAGAGQDLDGELVADHCTHDATVVWAGSPLEPAAERMVRGRFRHLIVVDDAGERVGVLSMRDVVRGWLQRPDPG